MTLEIVTMKEKLEQGGLTLPEPIVSGLLFRKSMCILGAPEDSFKTNWALQLAICLASGIPCYSYSCRQSRIVYLVLEGGEDYILERLEEKIAALDVAPDEVMARIYVDDCSMKPLDDENVAQELEDKLTAIQPTPDVVIFDPITYALNEDVRFSPEKSKLCRNLIRIATTINGVTLPVLHCRKGAHDNDNMDDLLGSSVVVAAAATRIKLFRDGDSVNMYVKTRYAERPEKTSLCWKHPLLEIRQVDLKPREEAKAAIMVALQGVPTKEVVLGELVNTVAKKSGHNEKTVRSAVGNLVLEGKVALERVPKSATKKVKLIVEDEVKEVYVS